MPKGEDDVSEYFDPEKKCYCTNVHAGSEIEIIAHSYLPVEPEVTDKYTVSGRSAIQGHEGRRKKVMKLAFDAYLAPAELDGSATKRCNEVCRKTAGEAEKALRKYLHDLRDTAIDQYKDYNIREQGGITREGYVLQFGDFGALTGLDNIYKIKAPGALTPPECPKSDCPGGCTAK